MNSTTDVLFHQCHQNTNAPSVVILHGLFGSTPNFTGLAKALSPYFNVVRLDLRNHGRSFHHHAMDYCTMADDVVRTLNSLGISRCVLIGHSMGGKVAIEIAARYSAYISHLVVVDIAPKTYPLDTHSNVLHGLNSLVLEDISSRQQADQHLQEYLDDAMLRQFLLSNLQRGEQGFEWRINLAVLTQSYANIAASPALPENFLQPCLFVLGGASDYVSEQDRLVISRHFDHVVFNTIEGAGHWLHAEAPKHFWQSISAFLEINT